MDEAERGLYDLLRDRLRADNAVDNRTSALVLAAWEGEDDLAAALDSRANAAPEPAAAPPRGQQPDAYLAAVHVEGFRGIGPPATLPLRPGPGLTLVTGRNGSGKSSFAEATELALTGESKRWSGRSAVWKQGWRNLHITETTSVAVDLVVAGTSGTSRVECRWAPAAELGDGRWTRRQGTAEPREYHGTEWRADLETYRPFLSYSELGALIDGKPSELHDALYRLLGLEPLSDAQERLRLAAKHLADDARDVGVARRALRAELADVDDPRVARAVTLLRPTAPDLPAVAALVAGVDGEGGDAAVLTALADLHVPESVAEATARIRTAADNAHALAVDETRTADEVAVLLRGALRHHEGHGGVPCPVCRQGTLDDAWRADATRRVESLEHAASKLRQATVELNDATAAARGLVPDVPAALAGPAPVDVEAARAAWTAWVVAARTDGPTELARALDVAHPPLVDAVGTVRKQAQEELTQRDEVWAPIARRLAAWHEDATRVAGRSPQLTAVKKAEAWLVAVGGALRDERLAPFAGESQRVWRLLRQQSSVELGPVRLDGRSKKASNRRVVMDVSIDGTDGGTALGVMSQGELHALGLSLFLPRATVDQSPFRFVMIDDPVQAMDPAKVDGLARVLAGVAATRQVVVFTHDDRLADAVRRLELPATVWEVQRGERSVVEMLRCDDPVQRYLRDAHAMARTSELPPDIRGELVASCCRSAVEAACHAKIRSVRLTRGDTHATVEAAIEAAVTTYEKAALAVFDDARHSGVGAELRSAAGPWAAAALQNCKQGAHHGLSGDLDPVVRDARRLAEWLQR